MSRSDVSSVRLPDPTYPRPASKAHSVDYCAQLKPTTMVILNVVFLGETNLGNSSIVDLTAGPGNEETLPGNDRALGNGARSVTLDGKLFALHALRASESVSTGSLREKIQNTLADLCKKGGIHLLVYCMNASRPISWIHNIHPTVTSYSPLVPPHIPAVAIVTGLTDVAEQETWWTHNEDAWAKQRPHFDAHAFICMMANDARSPTGDHISESRRILHELILRNCNSVTESRTPYQRRSLAKPFQSLFHMKTGKPPRRLCSPTVTDIVLLGESGVGKSSLVNLIARKTVASVSPDTETCTTTADMYSFEEEGGRTLHLYDTPGLVDPERGDKDFIGPIDVIQKKIRDIGNGKGPDLLLFCINGNSKPTSALQRNYRLFCKIICGGRVPFALVITKLGGRQNADQWWDQHKATIRGYGIDCSGYVGFGHMKNHPDPDVELAEQSRETLLSFFIACANQQKQRAGPLRLSMGRIVDSLTTYLRSQVSTLEKTLMDQCALESEHVARELASRLAASEQNLTSG